MTLVDVASELLIKAGGLRGLAGAQPVGLALDGDHLAAADEAVDEVTTEVAEGHRSLCFAGSKSLCVNVRKSEYCDVHWIGDGPDFSRKRVPLHRHGLGCAKPCSDLALAPGSR